MNTPGPIVSSLTRFWRVGVCLVVLAPPVQLACINERGREGSHLVVDDLNRNVAVPRPATRIVSLSPAITELVFAVGAGERLVGRTRWDVYPPEALHVTDVGDGLPPNVEVVAAVDPDLVLMYAAAANRQATDHLEALGIPAFSVHIDRLETIPRLVRLLGQLTDREAPAESIATNFQHRLDSASAAVRPGTGPSVVILTWDNPPIVIGGGSFLSTLVTLAGGRNVFDDIEAPSSAVTIETIVARNPDVIWATGGSQSPSFAERREWNVVRAVAARRFIVVEGNELAWPSLRAFTAVDKLRAAFTRVDPGW